MKKILTLFLTVFATLTVIGQPPLKRDEMGPMRPLPNQFRDFVDFQQGFRMEIPNIETKDGKVIITMSEESFRRMMMFGQMHMRRNFSQSQNTNQRFNKPPMMCEMCRKNDKKK